MQDRQKLKDLISEWADHTKQEFSDEMFRDFMDYYDPCPHENTQRKECSSCGGCGEGSTPDSICGRCKGTGNGPDVICLDCGETL